MSESAPEAKFHSYLFTRLNDFIEKEETAFTNVSIEERTSSGTKADIIVKSDLTTNFIIEVKKDDINPFNKDVVKQARDYADEKGTKLFAACNSNDLFLFDYGGETELREIPYYYYNLRDCSIHDSTMTGFIPELLRASKHLYEYGNLPDQTDRKQIVGLLRSFHSTIWPAFRELSDQKYGTNPTFSDQFDEWVQKNDYNNLSQEEQLSTASKQYAYLLTNKILFYEYVRVRTPNQIETKSEFQLDAIQGVKEEAIEKKLRQQFNKIVEEIDYEPVFNDDETLFAKFPHNTKTKRSIKELLENIGARNIGNVDEDLLGGLYEELIPKEERKQLGQYYTPPEIAEVICRWAIDKNDTGENISTILDPATGSGTFLVEAYKRLDERHPDASHEDFVDSIYGVDINKFPLHLSALNIVSRRPNQQTDHINTTLDSFFNIDPKQRLPSANGSFPKFDAVVGNPPYIRQENLYPDKEHFRSHLKQFGASTRTTYYDGSKSLPKKTDAYVYFTSHAMQFLRDGGRLGYVVPTKWLDTRYGEAFQEFLYDHAKLDAIVGFSSRSFEDALVDTVLLLFEKTDNQQERRENTVSFVRVNDTIPPEDLASVVNYDWEAPEGIGFDITPRDEYRVVNIPQSRLEKEGGQKLGYYLTAPRPLITILNSSRTTQLSDYADISYGNKTGANRFFFIDAEEANRRGIDKRFLKPSVKSIRDMDSVTVTEEDSTKYLLDVSGFVEETGQKFRERPELQTSNIEKRVKDKLEEEGYDALRNYINEGEKNGHHDGRTCNSRKVWFNLGELETPDIFHPRFFNDRIFVIHNNDKMAGSDAIQGIDFNEYNDLLSAILNSTLYKATLELWGRGEGGGALQLLTYEVKSIPVPDPKKMDDKYHKKIINAGEKLIKAEDDEQIENARKELDEAVLESLDVSFSVNELEEMHRVMKAQRIEGASEVDTMVNDIGAFDDVQLTGFVAEDQTTNTHLSDFE